MGMAFNYRTFLADEGIGPYENGEIFLTADDIACQGGFRKLLLCK